MVNTRIAQSQNSPKYLFRNKLEYAGKKSEVNVRAEGSLEGKSHANVEVVLPTERCLTLKVDRDITSKDNVSIKSQIHSNKFMSIP